MMKPKRILFVENGIGYGGAVICLRHLVRNLDRSRFEPMVVTGRGGPLYEDITNDAPWKCIPDRRIDIPVLRSRLNKSRALAGHTTTKRILGQLLSRIDDICNFLPCLLGTFLLMLRWKPDLVHLNNEPLCNRAALIAASILKIPTISHVRGEQRGSFLMRRLFGLPTKFVTVSDWIASGVAKQGIPGNRIQRIYDGIELEKLDINADGQALRKQWGISPSSFTVGLVGLLIPWKGQRLFLEAGRVLLKENPDIVLVLAGGTPDECRQFEQELRQLASAPEFRDRVVFTGHVADMSRAYAALDVVVSASTSPEPLGTVVIESLALGRPLVAPAHGGALEMIEDGKTGLLFAPGNPESLAARIQSLHDDPALRRALGERARKAAFQTFAVSIHVEQMQSAYTELLNCEPPRNPEPHSNVTTTRSA